MSDTDVPDMALDEVSARLGQPGFYVYDVNGAARYARSHVPTARNVSAYALAASDLPEQRNATLVFYCSGPG